ncbi:ABC transporter permease [Bacillus sp. HMF5848]|uniref:ABC transporter permease n=1 Tax=Bacillus sp. HMF5848 TaxID=2495421 RepID=UPI000F7BB1A6|nr:ABC transporter permease [Bacillus sp. HMF5848]RSK28544.1 ABC transporter permease [Bacillus sp. HMF5848]
MRFSNLLKQDFTVAFRNYFHLVILVLVVLFAGFINFAIPKEVKLTPTEYIADQTEGRALESFLREEGVEDKRFYSSYEELETAVYKNDNSLGIYVEGTLDAPTVKIVHQGTESQEILNLLAATVENTFDTIRGYERESNSTISYIRPQAEPIAFNKNIVPIMVMTEAVMLGFLLISVMVFQEKEEGSVRAYRVSPGRTIDYIMSKAVVNVALGLVYGVLLVATTIGFEANYIFLITIISLACFFITMLGLLVSVFFKNLQEFLFVGVFIMAVLGFPVASYLSPSFAPVWLTWLPSYDVLFGLREALFSTGKSLMGLHITLLVESIVCFALAYWAVQHKLMKEGR